MSKKFYSKKHLSLEISKNENWAKFNHKQERSYRNVDDNWKIKLNSLSAEQKSKLLFKYAYEGNLKMVKAIINSEGAKVDVNAKDKDYNTALMYAIKGGDKDVVEFLAKRSNLNTVDIMELTPLHLAVRKNRIDLVAVLVDNGASIGILGPENRNVMFDAVAENNLEMMCALKLNGCDVNIPDKKGTYPLMYATWQTNRQMAMCELLRLGAYIDAYDKQGKNALMHAILSDNRSAMDILIKKGININDKDRMGNTALMYCAKMGNREGIRVLISKGVNIFAKNSDGKTALDIAIKNNFKGSAEILMKAQKILESGFTDERIKQELKKFAKQNKVENSCAK